MNEFAADRRTLQMAPSKKTILFIYPAGEGYRVYIIIMLCISVFQC